MPVLHNRISNETLKAQMLAETEPRTTISFYKYFTIVNPKATRDAPLPCTFRTESVWPHLFSS